MQPVPVERPDPIHAGGCSALVQGRWERVRRDGTEADQEAFGAWSALPTAGVVAEGDSSAGCGRTDGLLVESVGEVGGDVEPSGAG